MFFRIKRSGPRRYLQIVESRWEEGRSKQRVIATLGRAEQLRDSGKLEALLASGSRFAEKLAVLTQHRQRFQYFTSETVQDEPGALIWHTESPVWDPMFSRSCEDRARWAPETARHPRCRGRCLVPVIRSTRDLARDDCHPRSADLFASRLTLLRDERHIAAIATGVQGFGPSGPRTAAAAKKDRGDVVSRRPGVNGTDRALLCQWVTVLTQDCSGCRIRAGSAIRSCRCRSCASASR